MVLVHSIGTLYMQTYSRIHIHTRNEAAPDGFRNSGRIHATNNQQQWKTMSRHRTSNNNTHSIPKQKKKRAGTSNNTECSGVRMCVWCTCRLRPNKLSTKGSARVWTEKGSLTVKVWGSLPVLFGGENYLPTSPSAHRLGFTSKKRKENAWANGTVEPVHTPFLA